MPPDEIKISVRGLVEFILRSGDIDNRRQGAPDNAMQEGSRIHRMIQRRMGAEYQAEVPLRYTHPTDKYVLIVEGRADGIIDIKGDITIDEIKGTYRDLNKMREPVAVHVAQAKCYAYMYGLQADIETIKVRLTYCNIETEDIRYFYEEYKFQELEDWFQGLIRAYRKWADYIWEWKKIRQESIEKLEFPFEYREGQKELVTYVYQTIYHSKKLYLEAPTGVGKTVSTIFPSLKAMSKGMGEKLFYLTAKTITRTVAADTFSLLRQRGLRFKSVILTAKEKICFLDKPECNPEKCPYAKGHYDRVNEAIYDLLTKEENFTREKIEEYAERYQVCPFEMCLDMSLFSDGIIGDYNYLFDPHVYLKRFFGDGMAGNYIFLIDEAHNLLERGREMYSAQLLKEEFLEVKNELRKTALSEMEKHHRKSDMEGQLTLKMTDVSGTLGDESEEDSDVEADTLYVPGKKKKDDLRKEYTGKSALIKKGYAERIEHWLEKCNKEMLALKRECEEYCVIESVDALTKSVLKLHGMIDEYLDEQGEDKNPIRDTLLEFYFKLAHYLDIYERLDENYVKYTQLNEDGSFMLKLFCVNPRENLKECMQRGRSSILFSATFLPIQYYKDLLGGNPDDYEVYARSVFHAEKRGLFIANDVTSKYTRRSEEEYLHIAEYIHQIVYMREGNYMVFCPSYAFLKTVYETYVSKYVDEAVECIIQNDSMCEADREEFLDRFRECGDTTLIGFCVLGGIFGEGIDLKNDSLIGAIIVGTGLPQVCSEREILKEYFDRTGANGFNYAYRYPGMNKVLQAAGRVIRTMEDIGIVALLDERFLQVSYKRMFPREWNNYETVNVNTIGNRVERFWDSWRWGKM
ncbi:MAG: ATP-dependent DNA helicase [Acetatifactor sp.]|nr:ATP-dependent DNA helicase [Acetatifactor sp.]